MPRTTPPRSTTVLVRAPRRPAPVAVALGVAAATGLVGGVLTEVGQGVLPDAVAFAADSVAAWMGLAAAGAGLALAVRGPARSPQQRRVLAALAGLLAMEGLVAGYYLQAALVSGTPHRAAPIILWTLAGAVGGPVAGAVAGGWRARGRWVPATAAAVLAAAFVAEGVRAAATQPQLQVSGVVEAVVGVALLLLVPARAQGRAALLLVATGAWWCTCLVLLDRVLAA